MKLLCKLLGHKWVYLGTLRKGEYQRYKKRCERCDKVVIAMDVFPEKWLDKHMD